MQGIYIHIPYCLKKCAYCDFCSVPAQNVPQEYVVSLNSEIKQRSTLYKNNSIINTIYFGGGTPGLLSVEQLVSILKSIQDNFTLAHDAEITLEINPEVVTHEVMRAFFNAGVNRLSIGIQSLQENELQYLGRVHGAQTALNALALARSIFDNVSIDVMYGIPEQTPQSFTDTLQRLLLYAPAHISAYALTYEPGTALYAQRKEIDTIVYDEILAALLGAAGYEHYEISNYALRGKRSQHNMLYWTNQSYIGFGAAAHGYDVATQKRRANTDDVAAYIQGNWLQEESMAAPIDAIMMGLRIAEGCPIHYFNQQQQAALIHFEKDGYVNVHKTHVCATKAGQRILNNLLVELLSLEDG